MPTSNLSASLSDTVSTGCGMLHHFQPWIVVSSICFLWLRRNHRWRFEPRRRATLFALQRESNRNPRLLSHNKIRDLLLLGTIRRLAYSHLELAG